MVENIKGSVPTTGNDNGTEIVFILDRSGSMCGLEKDTIGGFNSMIEKQKKEVSKATVTTVLFSDMIETIHDRIELKAVPKMTEEDYFTTGCTALLDAVGMTIQRISKIHSSMEEGTAPERTLMVITTDGYENASREFTYPKLKKLIESKKESGWEFIFLGANIDAAAEAKKFGISPDRAVTYECDEIGIEKNYGAINKCCAQYCMSGEIDDTWREAIDDDFKKRGRKKKN